ncbi:hypothetical protein BDF21DRAFT_492088 [Thamnidium elegans]|nr:hypothetical protein BDF21DRAFT_492088 [Thamnidium elegans]
MKTHRITTFLHCIRLTTLITTIVIVIGSLFLYSSNATPLNISDTTDSKAWMIQSITDRRLISTLVAAQASIFCPLFVLLSPTAKETEACIIEILCQWLMPLGLALSWMFSILFDLKTTEMIGHSSLCLLQDTGCILFGFIYALKYAIVLLFSIEAGLVTLKSVTGNQIQLPTNEKI